MNEMISKLKNAVLDFLFPRECLGCGAKNPPNGGLCSECFNGIGHPSLPKKGSVFAAADYGDDVAKKAIWALKYRKARGLAEPLAELMFRRSECRMEALPPSRSNPSEPDKWLILPIPLTKKRLRERGFNQSELIAKYLSDKINAKNGRMSVRVALDVLYKIKDTPSQVSVKDKEERLLNLKNSFGVKNPESAAGKKIIIVDDVTTTGATLKEAEKTLKEAGAKKIIAMVAAR